MKNVMILFVVFALAQLTAQDRFAGVWHESTDPYFLSKGLEWDDFVAKWSELAGNDLRLIDIESYLENGTRKYSGVWLQGSDSYWLSNGLAWDAFTDKWTELGGDGLRLIDIETYLENGTRKYIGVWREGTDGYALYAGLDWPDFTAEWTRLAGNGFRLIDMETYLVNGTRKYAGVWRAGTDGYALYAGVPWADFLAKHQELNANGLKLIDIETYLIGGNRKFAGVWRSGSDPQYLWVGVDWENFVSKWAQLSLDDARLMDIETYGGGCSSDCTNQVVGTPYSYQITGEGLYQAPFETINGIDRIRFSAISFSDQFLTLPFSDTQVSRAGIWRYLDGNYHYAGDYLKNGGDDTFEVKAAADGTVIFVGWDNWSGNTVVVSHDEGGIVDAYRTIYVHLRNGATNDCNTSWSNSIPTLSGQNLTDYQMFLNDTGCDSNPALQSLDSSQWGTEIQTIPVTVNQIVQQGDLLAWAGNTGPGGNGSLGNPNTHLHIFWARRDLIDNQWYFFDPYGIYAEPDCYPTAVTDPLDAACARYSIAWKDGIPQYP